jgi:TrmH family RNA methyltransferase
MISIRKLRQLPRKTRLRKIGLLLQAEELELERGRNPHREYLNELAGMLAGEQRSEPRLRDAAADCRSLFLDPQVEARRLRREVNRLRHALLHSLGAEPAEWDLLAPNAEELDAGARTVLPMAVYLEDIRSPFNVGSIFRSCEAFAVQRVLVSPATASPLHPRAVRSARGAVAVIPWRFSELSALESEEGVFALELGGTSLLEFSFPRRGVMLVGSEELGLSPESLELAAGKGGRVSIPLAGAKRSLNVAVAAGIVLQAWYERLRSGEAHRSPG